MHRPTPGALSIATAWGSFLRDVIPKDAPPDQIREMRLAFHAGAHAMHAVVKRIGEPDISEAAAMEILTDIDREIAAFREETTRGT